MAFVSGLANLMGKATTARWQVLVVLVVSMAVHLPAVVVEAALAGVVLLDPFL
jgi:hypothetical protein